MKTFHQLCADSRRSEAGGVTFLALFMLALVLFIGATVLSNATRLYNGNHKVAGWQEALNAAEAGADLGLANLRWSVISASPTPAPTPFDSSLGWTVTTSADGNGVTNNTIRSYTTPHIVQAGEGTSETWAEVTVDSPIGDNTTSPPSGLTYKGNQWYRIRSTGHARLPGLRRGSPDILADMNGRRTNALRKFNFLYKRDSWSVATNSWVSNTGTLSVPEALRTIEVMVQPRTVMLAVDALNDLDVDGKQLTDSYDSSDSTKSTNGLYDPAKRQGNGGIGVGGTRNGVVVTSSNGDLSIGNLEKVYGNATTNGGTFADSTPPKIQSPGQVLNNVNPSFPMIPVPTWGSAGSPAINSAVTNVTSPTTITANSNTSLNYYKIANINGALTIAGTGTVNIWLTTGASTSGSITINSGASLKIYFSGGTFHPNNDDSINNLNRDPSTFQLYGVGTGTGSGPGIDIHIGGTTKNFYGTIYAPYRLLNLKYDGSTNYDPNSAFYGSFVGDSINLQGSVHFDEALNGVGEAIVDYNRASYVEDPR